MAERSEVQDKKPIIEVLTSLLTFVRDPQTQDETYSNKVKVEWYTIDSISTKSVIPGYSGSRETCKIGVMKDRSGKFIVNITNHLGSFADIAILLNEDGDSFVVKNRSVVSGHFENLRELQPTDSGYPNREAAGKTPHEQVLWKIGPYISTIGREMRAALLQDIEGNKD